MIFIKNCGSESQLIVWAYIMLALGAAVWFGGATPLAFSSLALILGCLAGITLFVERDQLHRVPTVVWGLAALAVGAAAWGAVQVAPGGLGMANPLWQQAAEVLGQPLEGRISLTPADTWLRVALILVLAVSVPALAVLGANRAHARILLHGLAWGGVGVCVYGLAVYALGNESVLWVAKRYYADDLSATFINRNTFATFAGLTCLLQLACLLERIGEVPSARRAKWRERWQMLMNLVILSRWHHAVAAVVAFVALLLSHSRAGVGFSGLAVLVMIAVLIVARLQSRAMQAGLLGMLVASTLVVLPMVNAPLEHRLERAQADSDIRAAIYATAWEASQQSLWMGTGLGSFEENFRIYRTPTLNLWNVGRVDHAHNTWLEVLGEAGLPVFVLVVIGFGALMRGYWTGLHVRRRSVIYPALGLATLVLVGGHGLVDFSAEFWGVGLPALVVLGVALAQSYKVEDGDEDVRLAPWKQRILLIFGLGVFAVAVPLLVRDVWMQASTQEAMGLMQDLRRDKKLDETGLKTVRDVLWPWRDNPSIARELALVDLRLAQQTTQPVQQTALLLSARRLAQVALAGSPADPYTWHRLALVQLKLKPDDLASAAAPLMMGVLTAPWDPNLVWGRLPLLVKLYPAMGPDDQDMVRGLLATVWVAYPRRTALDLRANPAALGLLAQAIEGNDEAVALWPRYMKMAYPLGGEVR